MKLTDGCTQVNLLKIVREMSWLSALTEYHMPPENVKDDKSCKSFDDFLTEAINPPSVINSSNHKEQESNTSQLFTSEIHESEDEIKLLRNAVSELQSTVSKLSSDNNKHKNNIKNLQMEIDDLWGSYEEVEKELYQFMQYNRRENVELVGLPSNIPDNKVEPIVLNILGRIGLRNLNHYDIAGCHRLKNRKYGPSNIIIRFINRKHAKECLANKGKLQSMVPEYRGITFIENLCPKYRSIYDQCSDLKEKNKIKHLWTFNGNIYIKKTDNRNEWGKKILHMSDIYYYFPNEKVD